MGPKPARRVCGGVGFMSSTTRRSEVTRKGFIAEVERKVRTRRLDKQPAYGRDRVVD
jgi:hypothetical protein